MADIKLGFEIKYEERERRRDRDRDGDDDGQPRQTAYWRAKIEDEHGNSWFYLTGPTRIGVAQRADAFLTQVELAASAHNVKIDND